MLGGPLPTGSSVEGAQDLRAALCYTAGTGPIEPSRQIVDGEEEDRQELDPVSLIHARVEGPDLKSRGV